MIARISADGGDDTNLFVTTVSRLVGSSTWRYVGEENAIGRARDAVEDGPSVIQLTMPGVEAQLELEYRPHAEVVCDVVLFSSLDPYLPHRDTALAGGIAASHNHIARKYATEFLEPQSDPHVLLTGTVPSTASALTIRTMGVGLAAAALEAEWLHDQIRTPLENYLSSTGRTDRS